ncbi:MAG: carbon-nitrogen hydrolase family protein [Oscillospiraceae bacterium]
MKIALASAKFIDKNVGYNLSQIIKFTDIAKENGANLVCFGEAFLQGFDSLCWNYCADKEMALSTDSDVFKLICEKSKASGVDILFGFIEKDGDKIHSSCALIENGALSHLYRRISKGWKEYGRTDEHYEEGCEVSCFNYCGKKCLVALCGDLWDFPNKFRLGEDILFWPVYISYSRDEWKNGIEIEYAEQALLACEHTLLINSICESDAFGGCFEFADGQAVSSVPMGKEDILITEI